MKRPYAKRANRPNPRQERNELPKFLSREITRKSISIIPRNLNQEKYVEYLEDPAIDIVVANGSAGSGKTYLATMVAFDAFRKGEVDRIILTRPAVSVDEKHGFLPGGIIEKMAPWIAAMLDSFRTLITKKDIEQMMEDGDIVVEPLAYMRGRSFKNSYIIADEMQNSTIEQFKMITTRIDQGSKLVLTGDPKQHDQGYSQNGLQDFVNKIANSPIEGVGVVTFTPKDVERHRIVSKILKLYGES